MSQLLRRDLSFPPRVRRARRGGCRPANATWSAGEQDIERAQILPSRDRGSKDSRLRRVDDYIRSHLDSSFSLQALAVEATLSRFHLLRLFKQTYGETPFRRLTRLRMEEAQRRLLRTRDSVTEISLACGYENPAHFAAAFRRIFGVSPTEFRRLIG
jgi:AraC family transcriptional regulator